ncbi:MULTISPECIES: 50S ribosomal protein L18 [Piscirickettsiaceae]|jgi:large subunit ribosomal protein L18|uniref:Large ribosomal subunit protein uL18 n=1 Tax=Hydrogenovibrio thermophilus TaxID=265883 RepID=A0A451G4X4_9GAMM|nr:MULTISPECIES: 50S ribosomal protein L18 [Piscirickettsiaceae]AZR82870.1 50S ribosomal protein L18 [Thiomicrospira sp. S5]QAB14539.1 50S ribosomal protein L18 [Hydrogenovibrio thermophilus]
MDKKATRLRRAKKTRAKLASQDKARLCVHRTPKHIYAQIISSDGSSVVASSSTVQAEIKKQVAFGGNKEAAKLVGKSIAEKAKAAGIESVAFDRSGFKYHGRVQVLADSARENGLQF